MPRPGRAVQIGCRVADAAPAGAPDPTARCASASFGGAWSHFAPDVRGSAPYVRSGRDGRLPPPVYAEVPPPRVEYALPPHGPGPMPRVRNLVERAGTDAARSQLSGTGRANMAEILACRGADAPTARPPLARQPLPRRAAFRCSPPFPVRCIPGGIPPYPAAKSRNRTFVPLPTTV